MFEFDSIDNYLNGTPLEINDLPVFLRDYHQPDKDDLPDYNVALIIRKRDGSQHKFFPINSPTDTAYSMLCFDVNMNKLPAPSWASAIIAATNLARACEKYGMKTPETIQKLFLDKIQSNIFEEGNSLPEIESCPNKLNMANVIEEHIPVTDRIRDMRDNGQKRFAITIIRGGHKQNFFDISDKLKLAMVMKKFSEIKEILNPSLLKQMSENIVKTANEYGEVVFNPEIIKLASSNIDSEFLKTAFELRKNFVAGNDEAVKIADEFIKKHSDYNHDTLIKLAEAYDTEYGLKKHWHTRIPDPVTTVTGATETQGLMQKLSEEKTNKIEILGDQYTDQQLRNIDKQKFINYFGVTLYQTFASYPQQVIDNMTDDMKLALKSIIK